MDKGFLQHQIQMLFILVIKTINVYFLTKEIIKKG